MRELILSQPTTRFHTCLPAGLSVCQEAPSPQQIILPLCAVQSTMKNSQGPLKCTSEWPQIISVEAGKETSHAWSIEVGRILVAYITGDRSWYTTLMHGDDGLMANAKRNYIH